MSFAHSSESQGPATPPIEAGGHDDFDLEPVAGLEHRLPAGETVLWQGKPRWRALARRAYHLRAIAIYGVLIIAWRVAAAIHDGYTVAEALIAGIWLTAAIGGAIGLIWFLAWYGARTTIYTVTNGRLVMRFGMALPMNVDIPFRTIESVDLKMQPDGTGDLALTVGAKNKVSYFVMWPNVRPWKFLRPEPMLRGVQNPKELAEILTGALQEHARVLETLPEQSPESKSEAVPGVPTGTLKPIEIYNEDPDDARPAIAQGAS